MPSLFDSACGLLSEVLNNAEGKTYSYVRGTGAVVSVTAVRSRAFKEMFESDGATVEFEVYDFLMDTCQLEVGCDFSEPLPGDTIKDLQSGMIYEVLRDPNDTSWRYSDSNSKRIRVHTKQRAVDGAVSEYKGDSL